MKHLILILVLLSSLSIYAQKERSTQLGRTTLTELKMKVYDKDPSAAAVILYDEGNYYRDDRNSYELATDYYRRVKIFDKDNAQDIITVSIYTRKENFVKDIKGITYTLENGIQKSIVLSDSDIFVTDVSNNVKKTTFTLPNISSGCVIEYSYKVLSKYLGIRDWYFQGSKIPRVKSVFKTAITGNYTYNVKLVGPLPLNESRSVVTDRCLKYGDGRIVPCATSTYEMIDVPAFKTEDFMLSEQNYLAHISYNLESIITAQETAVGGYGQGVKTKTQKITKTWKDTDKTVRLNVLNNQGTKKSFFKKQLPATILENPNDLEKARQVYSFIQNHYNWNKKNWSFGSLKIKNSFEEQTGNVEEINLALYNSLQAVKIESYITFVSTRNNGIPTKLFPIINDFDYVIIKAVVDGKDFFLDATNKFRPFGEIPFKCLNGEARVFNFKKGSYWQNLNTLKTAGEKTTVTIALNEEGHVEANLSVVSNGYSATNIRTSYANLGEEEYLRELSQGLSDSEIENYQIKNLKSIDSPIEETYQVISDESFDGVAKIQLYPLFRSRRTVNPFNLKERLYPVDFGYRRTMLHRITINIPEGYKVAKLPPPAGVKLPNNGAAYLFKAQESNDKVKIFVRYNINKKIFTPEEYFSLKEFFNKIIKTEGSYVEFEKI